jgi:hypothetical protein
MGHIIFWFLLTIVFYWANWLVVNCVENTEFFLDASKKVGIEINVCENWIYILMSLEQRREQTHNLMIIDKSSENMKKSIFGKDSKKSKMHLWIN